MMDQSKYLQLKYDPRTRPFVDVVNSVLKKGKGGQTHDLTHRIVTALNQARISLKDIRSIADLQSEFPVSKICYNENNDRWFFNAQREIIPLEELMEISREEITRDAVKDYTEIIKLQVDTALEDTRFDKMLTWLGSFSKLRNDQKRFIDDKLIQQLLFAVTGAVNVLAEIGSKKLIEDFKKIYVAVKFDRAALKKSSIRGLLAKSENSFFDKHMDIAAKNDQIHGLCNEFEKNGGEIEETSVKIKSLNGVNLKRVIPALLNLRKNYLILEIKRYHSLKSVTPEDCSRMESEFAELETLVEDERVNATAQAINNLTPIYLTVLEGIFLNPGYSTDERGKALSKALKKVKQKTAYANFKLGSIYELTMQAIGQMDKKKMESHLSFYKYVMEKNFKIFKKSMAQIKRETDEIRRVYQQKEMGL